MNSVVRAKTAQSMGTALFSGCCSQEGVAGSAGTFRTCHAADHWPQAVAGIAHQGFRKHASTRIEAEAGRMSRTDTMKR